MFRCAICMVSAALMTGYWLYWGPLRHSDFWPFYRWRVDGFVKDDEEKE